MTATPTYKSYGIALFRYNLHRGVYEILLVKKRHTYYFLEIVNGKYRGDQGALMKLYNKTTLEEKILLSSGDFKVIWFSAYTSNPDSIQEKYRTAYLRGKLFYEKNMKLFSGHRNGFVKHGTQPWDIPKGRRSPNETEFDCAIREFTEETKITTNNYEILFHAGTKKYTISSEKGKYECTFYVAVTYDNTVKPCVSLAKTELVDAQWMSPDQISIMNIDTNIFNLTKSSIKLLKRQNIRTLTKLNQCKTSSEEP